MLRYTLWNALAKIDDVNIQISLSSVTFNNTEIELHVICFYPSLKNQKRYVLLINSNSNSASTAIEVLF